MKLTPLLVLLATWLLSACGGTDDAGTADDDDDTSGGMSIRISFADTELTARLDDTETARELAAQLPLTLSFRDHNGVEKTAPLPRALPVTGAPAGHDPTSGDIGYWAPGGDLVLYYDDHAPYFDGIVRIGRFEGDPGLLAPLPEEASATIER